MSAREIRDIDSGKQILKAAESGSRTLTGTGGRMVFGFAVLMSLFQLYTGFAGELAGSRQLSVHLFFAMVLCFIF